MLPRHPRSGVIYLTCHRIAAEFWRLRSLCAEEGLPDPHYGSPQGFVRHVFEDHAGAFDPVADTTLTLGFKDASLGLIRTNIVVQSG